MLAELHLTGALVFTFNSTVSLSREPPEPGPENVYILGLQIHHNRRAGLQLGQLIRQADPEATIIFITVHDELLYITYKYRLEALDFISKDHDNIRQELLKDFSLITHRHQWQETNVFHYKSYKQTSSILLDDICYFKSNNLNTHAATIYTSDFRTIEIHQNYLVNSHLVKKVDFYSRTVIFYNGMTCPISRCKAKQFFELVRQF